MHGCRGRSVGAKLILWRECWNVEIVSVRRIRIVSMNSVTLENFRCFGEKQTVRLAPLTLLVGENSTGKTSFLALIRALWDMAYESRTPDFREYPFDLGSFDEIAHSGDSGESRADRFDVGFAKDSDDGATTSYSFSLVKDGTVPVQARRRISRGEKWIQESLPPTAPYSLRVGSGSGQWRPSIEDHVLGAEGPGHTPPPMWILYSLILFRRAVGVPGMIPIGTSRQIEQHETEELLELVMAATSSDGNRPFASAPVRSKPLRTYDSSRINSDPDGDYVPACLSEAFSRDPDTWHFLKGRLEEFGSAAGLFNEIEIKPFESDGNAFRVRVKDHSSNSIGQWRNLVDVGYGVSQALPIVTELWRPESPSTFLLQQPEVHLHPMAQAALGSLFCQVAGANSPRRQLIIETHSDHLINRVRMDVRDAVGDLTPDDVVVLYFERDGLDVKIHEVTFDSEGNVDAPSSYGRFFMEETSRSIWPDADLADL